MRPVTGGGAPILRRAVLADVPAAARLILQSEWCPQWDLPSPQALRLVLAHVALDAGELWVAEGAGELVASVVAVPPPTATPKAFGWSLRLELRPAERNAAASSGHALPEGHWLVLGSWNSGTTAVRSGLLRRALAAVDRRGLPAAAVGPQTDELREAGFAESVGHQAPSCVLLRPAR